MTEPTQHADTARGRAVVVQGDARALVLPDASVDLVITSPPYFAQRDYRQGGDSLKGQIGMEATPYEYLENLWAATEEMARVLAFGGSIWVNLGDKFGSDKSLMLLPQRYAAGCVDKLGLIVRSELIWSKPNGLPSSAPDRIKRSHEHWYHLTKQGRYYADLDSLREPHVWLRTVDPKWAAAREATAAERGAGHRNGKSGGFTKPSNPLGKIPGSVWSIGAVPGVVHPDDEGTHYAAFSPEWPIRLIGGWCPKRGVVLDPFGGTGTVTMMAKEMGRTGISVDLSADYCRLAQWRINESGHGAKALMAYEQRRAQEKAS